MSLGRRMKGFMGKKLAQGVDKEVFLEQLRVSWRKQLPLGKSGVDVEAAIKESLERINRSGLKNLFDVVGITEVELREALLGVIGGLSTTERGEKKGE